MTCALIGDTGSLIERLENGLERGFRFYEQRESNLTELAYYDRLRDLRVFRETPEDAIRSSGYVVDTIEAAVWSLITTESFEECELKAVNLGEDTDTVGAIAGGLAGLYYGYEAIPKDWLSVIQRREWIEELCKMEPKMLMSRKDRNKEVFHDTQCFYLGSVELMTAVAATRRKQELILEEETVPAPAVTREKDCAVVVSGKRTLEAAHAYKGKKTCVLNFASAVNPGGGVLWGSGAQEESICRCSTLYPCLDTKEMWNGYYDPHREKRNPLNNDDMIYSPDVLVIKTDTDMPERLEKKDWYPVNVITCAAPDLRWSHHFNPFEEMESAEIPEEEFRALLESRIRRIFREAAAEGNDVLILGAFGCGAFHNPPRLVADVFRQITEEYRRCFETIEYAVFHAGSESENYLAFKEAFKTMTGC